MATREVWVRRLVSAYIQYPEKGAPRLAARPTITDGMENVVARDATTNTSRSPKNSEKKRLILQL